MMEKKDQDEQRQIRLYKDGLALAFGFGSCLLAVLVFISARNYYLQKKADRLDSLPLHQVEDDPLLMPSNTLPPQTPGIQEDVYFTRGFQLI